MLPCEMIKRIREAVDNDEYELTEWEEGFMDSVEEFLRPSDKQVECLERIYKKATKEE